MSRAAPAASALSTTPLTISKERSQIPSGAWINDNATSAVSPTAKELAIVPRPGSSRSGIQRTSTTRLITMTAVPMLIGRWIAMPW